MRKATPIIISIITVVITIASWNFLYNSLYAQEVGLFGVWIKPIIGFIILVVLFSLAALLIESKKIIIPTFLVSTFSFFLIFSFNGFVLLALAIFLGMLFLGRVRIRDELKVRLKIRIGKALQKGVPLILTSLVLVIAVSYCFTPSARKFEIKIPQKFLEPFQELLIKQFVAPGLSEKVDLLKNQKISEAVNEIINTKIEEFTKPYKQFIPLALAISLFLFLRIVAIPVGWLITLFVWIIFKLLVAFGVIRIEKVPKEAEIIKM